MTSRDLPPKALFAGRTLAFLGIALLALNMRTAVTGLSPLIPAINESFELSTFAIALLGSIAPLCFASSGIFTPRIERRLGLERTLILAILLMIAGHFVRALSQSWGVLAIGSLLALIGMGISNVAMPPAVRKYFPDRIGTMTAVYMTLLSVGSFVPPLIAVPVAESSSWRVSIAQWGFVAVTALVPWIIEYAKHRKDKIEALPDGSLIAKKIHLWRSPTAWTVGLTLAVSSVTGYAMYAWMPVILHDIAGATPAQAGAILGLYTAVGLPTAFIVPILANKFRGHIHWFIWISSALFVIGYLGLLLVPTQATWLWAAITGIACLEFPLSLTLINLRTENVRSSMALSGFSQLIAYLFAALAPPVMGISHSATQSWDATLIGLLVFSVVVNVPIAFILKRNNTVDAELKAYTSSHLSAR